VEGDLALSLETASRRAERALLSAAGVQVEATAPRELLGVKDTLPVTVNVYNQGKSDVVLEGASVWMQNVYGTPPTGTPTTIVPDSAGHITLPLVSQWASVPWWLENGFQTGTDMFRPPTTGLTAANTVVGEDRVADTHVRTALRIAGVSFVYDDGPVVYRFADPARGEQRRPVVSVPAISLVFDDEVEYARVGTTLDREYALHVSSATSAPRSVTVELSLPKGMTADSVVRRVALEPFGSATVVFHAKGQLPAGRHFVSATATSNGETYMAGWKPITYAHIRPLRYYQMATVQVEAVDAQLPRNPHRDHRRVLLQPRHARPPRRRVVPAPLHPGRSTQAHPSRRRCSHHRGND